MEVRQGEVYHVDLPEREDLPEGWESGPSGPHPVVVISHDSRNASDINTVAVCVLTHNLDRGDDRGNVTLSPREANLPRQSVVNVSQILTLDKRFLGRLYGQVDLATMRSILQGIHEMLEGYKVPY